MKEIIKKMKAEDVTVLVKSFVLSEEATSKVPLDARKEIIKKAIKYCAFQRQDVHVGYF